MAQLIKMDSVESINDIVQDYVQNRKELNYSNLRSYTTNSKPSMSFQQFIQRGKVLTMYRKYMRLLNRIPEKSTRKEMREWIRADFDRYKGEADPQRIDILLAQASRQFKEMQSSIWNAQSKRSVITRIVGGGSGGIGRG
ncbi:LYR motif-containing protein 2 [Coemansia sp. RSA 487]|nr:LYR motif-containing protein 2 [Coemansia sp. RSA 487]